MLKLFIAVRDAKGRMRSYDPANLPDDVDYTVRAAANAVLPVISAPGKRGRPSGYKCSDATVARMVTSRAATMAARKASA